MIEYTPPCLHKTNVESDDIDMGAWAKSAKMRGELPARGGAGALIMGRPCKVPQAAFVTS